MNLSVFWNKFSEAYIKSSRCKLLGEDEINKHNHNECS